MEKQFGILMAQFRQHRKSVEKEAGISNLIEEGNARDMEFNILCQLEKQRHGMTDIEYELDEAKTSLRGRAH